MPLRLALVPTAAKIPSTNFEHTVRGCDPAHWYYTADQRTLYDRLAVGDFMLFPEGLGGMKYIGQVIALYTDYNTLQHTCPITNVSGLVTKSHSLYWAMDPANPNNIARHIVVLRRLDTRLEFSDYRDYIRLPDGTPWDKTDVNSPPHRTNKVLDEDRAPELLEELRTMAVR